MRMILLEPKTPAMIRRVKDLRARFPEWGGLVWLASRERDTVKFTEKPGPWVFASPAIAPRPAFDHMNHARWVNLREDENFEVVPE